MKINGNDQFDLKGACLSGCVNDLAYNYKLYCLDTASGQWMIFTNYSYYHTPTLSPTDLTVSKSLFMDYSSYLIWRVDLITSSMTFSISTTSMLVYVNQPPIPSMCSINPTIGTTSTLFTINCDNWSDSKDGQFVNFTFYGIIFEFCKRY